MEELEKKSPRDDEQAPIALPLKILAQKTVNKRFGWWAAVVLVESYGRKQVCFYLWQKTEDGGWKRKQKFAVHNQEDWELIQLAVSGMIKELT